MSSTMHRPFSARPLGTIAIATLCALFGAACEATLPAPEPSGGGTTGSGAAGGYVGPGGAGGTGDMTGGGGGSAGAGGSGSRTGGSGGAAAGDAHGDGACTAGEDARSAPSDCPAVRGDGLCTHDETAASTPADCPAGAGDGLCTHNEDAARTPRDCPPAAGDGLCTHSEDAATTPRDCPPVAGDGLCTHDETFASALQDCPPPDVVFPGGSLDDLQAYSPELVFGELTLTGELVLEPFDSIDITAESFRSDAAGDITFRQGSCDYYNAPNVTITASRSIVIEGLISLFGKSGSQTTTSSSCLDCSGTAGGDVTLVAPDVVLSTAIYAYGGQGSNTFIIGDYIGCDGADGGAITIDATTSVLIDQGDFSVYGGRGGPSSPGYSESDEGRYGSVHIDAPQVDVNEDEPNGGTGFAPFLPWLPMVLHGSVSSSDDAAFAGDGGTISVVWPSGEHDRLEDLLRVRYFGATPGRYRITVRADNASSDVNVYLVGPDGDTVVGGADTVGPVDSFDVWNISPGEEELLGVTLRSGPATAYTLTVAPY